jgi:hypothetical protein
MRVMALAEHGCQQQQQQQQHLTQLPHPPAYPAQMDVVVFGGQRKGYKCPHDATAATTLAGRTSYRIKIDLTQSGG